MSKIYHCSIEVRGYELDSFGHVNHAVYISYLEHARWKLLEEAGIDLKYFDDEKRWPVIAEIHAQYLKPTFLGEKLEIQSTIIEHGKTHFLVEQKIMSAKREVFRGKVRAVMINENGRPASVPAKIARLWDASPQGTMK